MAQQLQLHPRVKQAAVRLDTLALPPRLKAFVVLRVLGEPAHRQEVEAWALDTLPWYAAPGSVTYGDTLPQNAMGKPSDWPVDTQVNRSS